MQYIIKRIPNKLCCFFIFIFFPGLSGISQEKNVSTFEWVNCPNCPFPTTDTVFMRQEKLAYGYLTVPENRLKPNGRKLRLSVLVFKSLHPNPTANPLVILHGGPGGNIVGETPWQFALLRNNRDIIAIDQRGSGTSEPDFSPEMNKEILDILAKNLTAEQEIKARTEAAIKSKARLLKKGIDLEAYNSAEIASDINDLCNLLGYKSWDLWGSSYGTRIALTLMRDHPKGIRSVILESPLPPNVKTFEKITSNFKNSINSIFDKCANDPVCKESYPNLREDFKNAIDSLEKNPIVIPMNDKARFPEGVFVINSQDMLLGLQQSLYGKAIYPVIPLLIEQIKSRNIDALRTFVLGMSSGVNRLHYGLYYTVICQECMPFNDLHNYKDSSAGVSNGLTFYEDEFHICNSWNTYSANMIDSAAIFSNIPVLILSGELDPMAPPSNGEIAKSTLPNSFWYVFENTGHFVSNENYAVTLIEKFLGNPNIPPDSAHLIKTKHINFATNVHIKNGLSTIAAKLELNKKNLPYTIWLLLILVCGSALIYRSVKQMISRKSTSRQEKLISALIAVNSICSIVFIIIFIINIFKTVSENYFLLGFGLPKNYSYVLLIPYIIIGLFLTEIVMIVKNRKTISSGEKYRLLLHVPIIAFIFAFNLFY